MEQASKHSSALQGGLIKQDIGAHHLVWGSCWLADVIVTVTLNRGRQSSQASLHYTLTVGSSVGLSCKCLENAVARPQVR